jgi:hypothetical protein
VVTSVGHVGKISFLVLVRPGVNPKKDLRLQVWNILDGNQRDILAQGRLRMILRLRGQEEPVEVGVLCHVH